VGGEGVGRGAGKEDRKEKLELRVERQRLGGLRLQTRWREEH